VAYQLDGKTVIRGGFGVTYARTADFNWTGASIGVGYNTLTFSTTSFGDPAVVMRNGLNYNLADLYQAAFDPGIRPSPGQLNSPNALRDHNGGRPPRVMQWSIAVQRELTRNLMLEVSYVGNRAAWLEGNGLVSLNALTSERLRSFGLDINNPTDRADLRRQLGSTQVRARGFSAPYPGFPTTATLAQSLRPYPQFGNVGVQWAPLGNSWYDSLQITATKRYSHGVELMGGFTWQKELERTGGGVNDVFNRENQKYLASQSQPFVFVASFNYETPKLGANRVLRNVVGGWNFSGLFRYASGSLIAVPGSTNNLNGLLFQGTRMNRVPDVPLYLKDLNCHCIDPNKDFVLNPAAWEDVPDGQWGYSARYYNDYRYQRRPDEQLSVGRTFRFRERYRFHVRAEFFNAFNRTFMANPDAGNPLATQIRNATTGVPQSGFGRINSANLGGDPRFGQLVARFEF
jgi:hypothetical protein